MEKNEKFQKKLGESKYLNKNCWLIRFLNYAPYKRCQYCELKFHNCLFLHYQIISLILIIFILTLSFLVERKNSEFSIITFSIITVFTLVIVYGHFFNKSTDKLILANFSERKAKELLEDFNKTLQQKIDEQTKEIREARDEAEKAYEIEKKAHQQEKENRERAEKLTKEFERLDRAKTQFMMATQHHLRTPLSIMKNYISLILEGGYGKISKEAKHSLSEIYNSIESLIKVVNEFLDVSQLQVGKEVLNKVKTNIIDFLNREVVKELLPSVKERGLYLKLQPPKEKIPEIMIDQIKMKTAIYNIVDNGLKYTEKGGVTIKLQIVNGKLQIAVKDTGIGITKEEIEGLFERTFERGKEAEKLWGLGRGIGLYLGKHIIEAHEGKIWVESEGEGKGSTFYIELPIE